VANRTLLLVTDSANPPGYEPKEGLLGANYSVPILWLSLFTVDDLVSWPSTVDSGSEYAAVLGRRHQCITRSRRRFLEWSRLWRPFEELGRAWMGFLERCPGEFISIWTEELAWMYESVDQWSETFSSWLNALDNPRGQDFTDVMEQSYLTVDSSGELIGMTESPLGLLAGGYSWSAQAPWPENGNA
jgi:hypothetical protein